MLSILAACAGRRQNNLLPGSESADSESNNNQTNLKEEYNMQELSLHKGDMKIYGQIYLPGNGTEQYPTVIIGHGFGGSYSDNIQNAKELAQAGYACYIFDFCGGSPYSSSDGSMLDMSVMTEAEDMEAVLEQMEEQSFVDQQNIFLMGESQGGLVAALTASEHMSEIKGLILYYPAFVIPDNTRAQYRTIDEIPDTATIFGMKVGKKYHSDVFHLDVYASISAFTKDVLIVHGDRDGIVPISYSERAVDAYDSAKLITIQGAGHGFNGEEAELAMQSMISYIAEHTID